MENAILSFMETLPTARFQVLNSLRGICACMIVLLHCRTQGIIFNNPLVSHGYLFVDFFFVLSGFVISSRYTDKIASGFSISRFMFLRWGRIYPLHLVMLLIYVVFDLRLAALAPGPLIHPPFSGSHSLRALVSNLLLIHIFVGRDHATWNALSWSIAAEFWTYLVFAGMFRWLRPLLVPACLALALACAIYLLLLNDHYINVIHDGALARCLYGFALGVSADRLFSSQLANGHRRFGFASATTLEILVSIAVLGFIVLAGGTRWSLICPVIFFLAILIFALEGGAVSRLLLKPPMLFLGMLSYSIYMVHQLLHYRLINILELAGGMTHRQLTFTFETAQQVGGGQLFSDAMSMALLVVTIATAWVTYHFIERPARNWSRRQTFFTPSGSMAAQG